MRKVIILLCFSLVFSMFGCTKLVLEQKDEINVLPPIINDDESENIYDSIEENDDVKRKKKYVVSTVNSLTIRSSATTNSSILGYLDKNDALTFIGEKSNFYQTTFKEKTAYVSKSYSKIMEIEIENEKIENAIDLGATLLGYPYVWGSQRYHWGNGKLNTNYVHGQYDCSALVLYVYFKSNNIILDVTSRTQSLNGIGISLENLKRGDLMFFTNESRKNKSGIERIGHVGIYFGNNYILHTASDHAVIEPISNVRWSYYITSRRVA